jgi:hypothetical protein
LLANQISIQRSAIGHQPRTIAEGNRYNIGEVLGNFDKIFIKHEVGKMSIEQAIAFMEKTAADRSLQQQLQEIMLPGKADTSSLDKWEGAESTPLPDPQGTAVLKLAANYGFEFSLDELIQVIDMFAKHQSGEISEAEFTEFISSSNLHQDFKDHLFSAEQTIELVFLNFSG